MTQEEKLELIATRIMGWRDENPESSMPCWYLPDARGRRRSVIKSQWLIESDLNLTARVEAKIAEMGPEIQKRYFFEVQDQVWLNNPEGNIGFVLITAPASARVDAMVALIQGMEK